MSSSSMSLTRYGPIGQGEKVCGNPTPSIHGNLTPPLGPHKPLSPSRPSRRVQSSPVRQRTGASRVSPGGKTSMGSPPRRATTAGADSFSPRTPSTPPDHMTRSNGSASGLYVYKATPRTPPVRITHQQADDFTDVLDSCTNDNFLLGSTTATDDLKRGPPPRYHDNDSDPRNTDVAETKHSSRSQVATRDHNAGNVTGVVVPEEGNNLAEQAATSVLPDASSSNRTAIPVHRNTPGDIESGRSGPRGGASKNRITGVSQNPRLREYSKQFEIKFNPGTVPSVCVVCVDVETVLCSNRRCCVSVFFAFYGVSIFNCTIKAVEG